MSFINNSKVSVKEYAESRGKTVQAVYQQIKRKKNAVALEGHIFFFDVGNKNVMYLDDAAIEILDRSSGSSPLVVIETKSEEELIETKKQFESLKLEYMKLQGRCELLQEQLQDQNQKLLVIDSKNKEIDMLEGFIQEAQAEIEAQKAHNLILSNEKNEAIERALKAEKIAQSASDELLEANAVIERLKNRNFFQRLFKK